MGCRCIGCKEWATAVGVLRVGWLWRAGVWGWGGYRKAQYFPPDVAMSLLTVPAQGAVIRISLSWPRWVKVVTTR